MTAMRQSQLSDATRTDAYTQGARDTLSPTKTSLRTEFRAHEKLQVVTMDDTSSSFFCISLSFEFHISSHESVTVSTQLQQL